MPTIEASTGCPRRRRRLPRGAAVRDEDELTGACAHDVDGHSCRAENFAGLVSFSHHK
jgi:hypothetical protein